VIILLSEVPVEPESETAAVEILRDMAAESRAEPGVIDYRVTSDLEEPDVFRIIETYEDGEAVQAHETSAHLDEFQQAIAPYMAGEPALYRYDVATKTEMDGP